MQNKHSYIFIYTPFQPATRHSLVHSLTIIIAYLVLLSHFTTENARAELGRLFNFTPAGIPRKKEITYRN